MPPVDPTILVPNINALDSLRFALYVLASVYLPGAALRRLLGLNVAARAERWAVGFLLGVLWSSFAYFGLARLGLGNLHLPISCVPLGMAVVSGKLHRLLKPGRIGRGWSRAQLAGIVLAGAWAACLMARVSALVEYDERGLRLYGSMYTDKLTVMCTCAALEHEVPPRCLRLAGYSFPSHYFPHLFVAAAARATKVDYVNLYWFHAAALGVLITGLSVLAFCRRCFRSDWVGCAALGIYGLHCFNTGSKTFDLTLPLLLIGCCALSRFQAAGRQRWRALTVLMFGVMPCYEVFHALTLYGGLSAWWCAGLVSLARRGDWQALRQRGSLVLPTVLVAWGITRGLYLGEEVVSPPQVALKSTYRRSFSHDWREWMSQTSEGSALRTIYTWQRGKPPMSAGQTEVEAERPRWWQRAAGEVVYGIVFLGYLLHRFVNAGIFGCLTLASWRRHSGSAPDWQGILFWMAVFGFSVPMLINWGHSADGQMWWTPNIYRLPGFVFRVALVVGAPAMLRALGQAHRIVHWPALAMVAWYSWQCACSLASPSRAYHLVEPDRLAALAFLRTQVPFGQTVIHPWVHDEIRHADRPDEPGWTYKRHFMLGSSLAGQQMFYEGREDHLFINGFVHPEAVYQRSLLRERFYGDSDDAVAQVLELGQVRWVVADADHPAPPQIARDWPLAYVNGTVRIFRKP